MLLMPKEKESMKYAERGVPAVLIMRGRFPPRIETAGSKARGEGVRFTETYWENDTFA